MHETSKFEIRLSLGARFLVRIGQLLFFVLTIFAIYSFVVQIYYFFLFIQYDASLSTSLSTFSFILFAIIQFCSGIFLLNFFSKLAATRGIIEVRSQTLCIDSNFGSFETRWSNVEKVGRYKSLVFFDTLGIKFINNKVIYDYFNNNEDNYSFINLLARWILFPIKQLAPKPLAAIATYLAPTSLRQAHDAARSSGLMRDYDACLDAFQVENFEQLFNELSTKMHQIESDRILESNQDERIRCPKCKELILQNAVVCRYCRFCFETNSYIR